MTSIAAAAVSTSVASSAGLDTAITGSSSREVSGAKGEGAEKRFEGELEKGDDDMDIFLRMPSARARGETPGSSWAHGAASAAAGIV